jgi:hypothetical protein
MPGPSSATHSRAADPSSDTDTATWVREQHRGTDEQGVAHRGQALGHRVIGHGGDDGTAAADRDRGHPELTGQAE